MKAVENKKLSRFLTIITAIVEKGYKPENQDGMGECLKKENLIPGISTPAENAVWEKCGTPLLRILRDGIHDILLLEKFDNGVDFPGKLRFVIDVIFDFIDGVENC